MRVAHVITRMIIGGAQENTLLNCLDLVQEYGDEVLLITGPSEGPEGALLEQGRAGGIQVRYIDSLRRPIHPLQDLRAYRQLKRVIQQFSPVVVHTHSAKGGFLGRLAAWKLRVPVVVHTVHGAPFHQYQNVLVRRLFAALEWYAARRCHHLISVADAMTELMVSAGVAPPNKFSTIYSGMRVEPFLQCNAMRDAARRELGIAPAEIVFGKIARLFHLKGHKYLVEAAKQVVAAVPNARFLLVGDGILRQEIERQIQRAGLSQHVLLTGLVPPERLPYYLSAMDVLVHASLREGLARALPQALIAGKPVISFDVDGAREVVLPGETGHLVPPANVQALADAMIDLAASKEKRETYGQRGREMFTDRFRHDEMTRQIRRLYVDLFQSRTNVNACREAAITAVDSSTD